MLRRLPAPKNQQVGEPPQLVVRYRRSVRMRWAVAGAATALVLFGVAVLPNTTSSMRLIQPGNQQQPGNALLGGLTPNAEAASHLLHATDGTGSTGSVGVVVGGPAALRGGTNGVGRGALEPTATITQTTGEGNTGGAAGTLPRLDIPITEPEWMHEEASMARFTRASAGVWSAESVGVRELGARSRSQDKEDVTAYKSVGGTLWRATTTPLSPPHSVDLALSVLSVRSFIF